MDKREVRSRAAKTFMENLEEQFNISLQENQSEECDFAVPNDQEKHQESDSNSHFSLLQLEEAIAALEEYMQTNKKSQPSSTSD